MRLDYIGIALLTLGVGALQVMLDKGQEDDWFGSRFILTLAIIAAVVPGLAGRSGSGSAAIRSSTFVSSRTSTMRRSNLMMFTLGILLFSSLVMMPQFLQTLLGYTAELAGLVLSGGAVVLLFAMPVVGQLTTKVQARYIIAFGWLCLASAMYYSTKRIDLLISFSSATWLRIAQVSGLGFLFVPITLVSYVGMPAGEEQRRRRHDQFHAQHRQQRRHLDGHDPDRATRPVSPDDAGRSYDGREPEFLKTRYTV